ncbi:hypothetical protein A499_05455 [Niallia nealsonii AAU1]|nr:hypothetical protein A499_05455 [Niallia nealsonii AAU1]
MASLARQLRPCRPKAEAAQREPHGKRTPEAESNILFKETNKYTIYTPLFLKFRDLSTVWKPKSVYLGFFLCPINAN